MFIVFMLFRSVVINVKLYTRKLITPGIQFPCRSINGVYGEKFYHDFANLMSCAPGSFSMFSKSVLFLVKSHTSSVFFFHKYFHLCTLKSIIFLNLKFWRDKRYIFYSFFVIIIDCFPILFAFAFVCITYSICNTLGKTLHNVINFFCQSLFFQR